MHLSTTSVFTNTITVPDSLFTYILFHLSRVFSYHTRTYYFSEFLSYNFLLSLIIMASMDITEVSFQTPASKKRKASGSPSLPPASQPTTPPSTYKNRSALIATGIDQKFNTSIRIMSELSSTILVSEIFKSSKHKKAGFS